MANDFDYYIIDSKNDKTYPLISIKGRDNRQNPTLMDIAFNDPIPRNPYGGLFGRFWMFFYGKNSRYY